MTLTHCFRLVILFFSLLLSVSTFAVEKLPPQLIPFASEQGVELANNNLTQHSLKLLAQFETQKTTTYCGVASAVMIFNASHLTPPVDPQHPPYHYFTQDNFFNDKVKRIISLETVAKQGMTLVELADAIKTFHLHAEPVFGNTITVDKLRETLITALKSERYIIVNFLRTELYQTGGGHHSPIAAYDEKTDSFLVLDPARYRYPAYWAKTQDLWRAMNTQDKDSGSFRGFIVISYIT